MKLSLHFDSSEWTCKDGTPLPVELMPRTIILAVQLEVVREYLGEAIIIDSGYRPPAYNRKIDGAKQSRHMTGEAGDCRCKRTKPAKFHAVVLELYRAGAIAIGGLGEYPTFTHVDVRGVTYDAASGLYIPPKRLARWVGSRSKN